jgi:ELWxxDGT repeat protein
LTSRWPAPVESLERRRLLSVSLLKDVDPSTPAALTYEQPPVVSGGLLYVVASDEHTGAEVWRSDGTAAGTFRLKDIKPGPYGSDPSNLVDVHGTLYFTAGGATWRTDGTPAGTLPVPGNPPLRSATVVGDKIFAIGYDDQHGDQLWVTDAAGPRMVKQIFPGTYGSNFFNFTPFGDRLLFTATDGVHGRELWQSDGTADGTSMLADLTPGAASSSIFNITPVGGAAYFVLARADNTSELWKTDGTPGGTTRVDTPAPPTRDLRVFGNTLLYATETQLWRTDGTRDGTVLLKQFPAWNGYGWPSTYFSAEYDGAFYFAGAGSQEQGYEFWRTDGTPAGTVLVRDLDPRPYTGSWPSYFTVVGGSLYFVARAEGTGAELWKSDGTAEGTTLVAETIPGPAPLPSDPQPFPLLKLNDSTLMFVADDGVHGRELWRSDGTAAGTFLVKDINSAPLSSNPRWLTRSGDNVFFAATTSSPRLGDAAVTTGLWKTDGTAAGTVQVSTVEPYEKPPPDSYTLPLNRTIMADVNGTLYFAGRSTTRPFETATDTELWKSDGTAAGTVRVADIHPTDSSYPKSLTNVNGRLFFVANHPTYGWELWTSDGTTLGTRLVKDIFPGAGAPAAGASVASPGQGYGAETFSPQMLTSVGAALYFVANDGAGWDLWKSDGTAGGTVSLTDLNAPSAAYFRDLAAVGNRLAFDYADRLWGSDGTPGGTAAVAGPAGQPLRSNKPVPFGGRLFFLGSDNDGPLDLWSTDGTSAGTSRAADLPAGSFGPFFLTTGGNRLYFNLTDVPYAPDAQLWKSDGTQAGTVLVKEHLPTLRNPAAAGGTLFFVDSTSGTGYEVWQTDGTAEGTFMNREIYPGMHPFRTGADNEPPLAPTELLPFGDRILFAAEDPAHGRELWTAAPSGPPHAVVGRRLFYNNSRFDGNDPGSGPSDDLAIADDANAVLPGERALADFYAQSFTNYSKGINGILIDVSGLPAGVDPDAEDFIFRTGTGPDVSTWKPAPLPSRVTVRRGEGAGGTDRVTLIWPDAGTVSKERAAVTNAWLQVTLKPGGRTGLDQPDTFYFGNLVGFRGFAAEGGAQTSLVDWSATRARLGGSIMPGIYGDDRVDFNRNGRFDAADLAAVRANLGRRLLPFVAPDAPADPPPTAVSSTSILAPEPLLPPAPRRRAPYVPHTSVLDL